MSFLTRNRTIARAEQYKMVFGTENGKQVLADIMKNLCINDHAHPHTDTNQYLWELNALHRMGAYIRDQLAMSEADYRRIMAHYEEQETAWQTNPPQMRQAS